jgi:signal transduction histidine kinase
MTRAKRPEASPLVVALVNWSLFACPGVNLDEIDIPIREFLHGSLPTRDDIRAMVGTLRANVARVDNRIGENSARILRELDLFTVDPVRLDELLGEPSLKGEGHGLHFVIRPVDQSLADGIDKAEIGTRTPSLTRVLIGFSNTMTPGHDEAPLKTAFNDRRSDPDLADDLIAEGNFWTPEDFRLADHTFRGHFDEFGQFEGDVSIYGEHPDHWESPWQGAHGVATECGPFDIALAHLQGAQRESHLGPEDWTELNRKLDDLGGLYIYRDGVRILPYGTADYDFIGIEVKRSKSAGYYFFSYRRLFGGIELRSSDNGNLQEKAGREGFRDNVAYRQFRDILATFFENLARQYFRTDGPLAEAFEVRKAELSRMHEVRLKRERSVVARRQHFVQAMDSAFDRVAASHPEEFCEALMADLRSKVESAKEMDDPERAAAAIVEGEAAAREKLRRIRDEFHIVRPRGVALARQLVKEWMALTEMEGRLERAVFGPCAAAIEAYAGDAAAQIQVDVARRRRFERIVQDAAEAARRNTRKEGDQVRATATSTQEDVVARARMLVAAVERTVGEVLTEANQTDVLALDDQAVTLHRQVLEQRLEVAADEAIKEVRDLRLRLEDVRRAVQGEAVADEDMMAAAEDEILELQQQSEEDMELVQLGMAMDIVNHEFAASVRTIRTNLRSLKRWSDGNPQLRTVYDGIRSGFDHLDGYLKLFTPLQRRLYREEIDITGKTIADFVRNLFAERLARHEIALRVTPEFDSVVIRGYPSTFLPVFVNLVDNAIFWIGDQRRSERAVSLDARYGVILVGDTGPGVPERDRTRIFDAGFTRKPAGRGLGLYIVKDVLNRVGWEIRLVSGTLGGAAFELTRRPEGSS